MIVASLFALILAQAEAPAEPQAAPIAAAAPQESGPVSTAVAPVESDIPKGAPADDFGLVSWCRGALTGHMALYQLVKPELRSLERPSEVATEAKDDAAQMQAGRDYLALYRRAMLTAEKDSRAPIRARGATLETQGEAIWSGARGAEPRKRMWTWLMWDLPGRCELAANRLEKHAGLAGPGGDAAGSASSPDGGAQPPPQSIEDALSGSSPPSTPPDAPGPVLRGPQQRP